MLGRSQFVCPPLCLFSTLFVLHFGTNPGVEPYLVWSATGCPHSTTTRPYSSSSSCHRRCRRSNASSHVHTPARAYQPVKHRVYSSRNYSRPIGSFGEDKDNASHLQAVPSLVSVSHQDLDKPKPMPFSFSELQGFRVEILA
eukprot:scpid75298/ scgid9887/ 